MRIRMLSILAGPDGSLDEGAAATVPDELGRVLIAGGFAAPLEEPTAVADDGPASEVLEDVAGDGPASDPTPTSPVRRGRRKGR